MKKLKIIFVILMMAVALSTAGLFVLVTGYAAQLWFPIDSIEDIFDLYEEYPEEVEPYEDIPPMEYIPHEVEIEEEKATEVVARKPIVAITFDDGPGRFTKGIVDLLYKHDARATFFVLGYRVERYPEIVMRAAEHGNEIANHSWSHARLSQIGNDEIYSEITNTSAVITSVTGRSPSIFRPPFGRTNDYVRAVAEDLEYAIINWTLDTLDWRYRDADRIFNVIMDEVEEGSIILLHDIHATTALAMERVIPALIEEGYQLVTVSELLEYLYENLEPGRIYGKVFDAE